MSSSSRSVNRMTRRTGLFLDHFDRNFRTIGLREPGLVFQSGRHRAVADFMRIAERVELEQFRRERFAAGVPLAFVLIDANSQLSRHSDSSPGPIFKSARSSFCLRRL